MKPSFIALLIGLLLGTSTAVCQDASNEFASAVNVASEQVQESQPEIDALLAEGDVSNAIEKYRTIFPKESRTAAQAFLLGNILFEIDRQFSYELHQDAVLADPDNLSAVWEWALQQHRAGELAGALLAYGQWTAARPESAASYALQADCLLRLNRVDDAVTAWKRSEQAANGTIETMESIVCAVKREPVPFKHRADLLAKTKVDHDVKAAMDLIALDCDFPFDWWNQMPHEIYLDHDLSAIEESLGLLPDDLNLRTMRCAADCIKANHDPAKIRSAISKHQLFTDENHTIPSHGNLALLILTNMVQSDAIKLNSISNQVRDQILSIAKRTNDTSFWHLALITDTEKRTPKEMISLERSAWNGTGDVKFALAVLLIKQSDETLTGDDPDLIAALNQFPENGMVWRIAYELASKARNVTQELLANAARSEFNHFSTFVAPATIISRPRSNYLREYFSRLAAMQN